MEKELGTTKEREGEKRVGGGKSTWKRTWKKVDKKNGNGTAVIMPIWHFDYRDQKRFSVRRYMRVLADSSEIAKKRRKHKIGPLHER